MTAPSIKILVVGCGSIGRRHLQVLSERRDLEIAACDPSPEALAAVSALVTEELRFGSLEGALHWQPAIVVIAAPYTMHRQVAVASFAAGANVLCEKPLAETAEDARAIIAAATKHGKVLAVGYSERYRPSIQRVIQLATSGEIGTLVGGRAMVGTYNTLLCAKTDYREHVFGALLMDYTHEFDFLRAIFGELRDLHCWANDLGGLDKKCSPALAATMLRFMSGAIVSVHMDYIQHPQRRLLEVFGDRGVVELDLQTDELKVFDPKESGCRIERFDHERNNVIRAEHQDMLDAVLTGSTPRVTGSDGLKALEIAELAIQQARSLR